jgi:hypothetical protein
VRGINLFLVFIIAVLSIFFVVPAFVVKSPISMPIIPTVEQRAQVVDEKMVVKTLKQQAQIVGSEGVIEKEFKYSDYIYKTNTIVDRLGERVYNQKIFARFKMGLDVENIKILVKENIIYVSTAKPILISLDVDDVWYDPKNGAGILRVPLSDSEKFFILNKAKESVRQEILNDSDIRYHALKNSQKIIEDLLKQIPNVKEVKFI